MCVRRAMDGSSESVEAWRVAALVEVYLKYIQVIFKPGYSGYDLGYVQARFSPWMHGCIGFSTHVCARMRSAQPQR